MFRGSSDDAFSRGYIAIRETEKDHFRASVRKAGNPNEIRTSSPEHTAVELYEQTLM